jgi:alpha/beta superfamily hydrolase
MKIQFLALACAAIFLSVSGRAEPFADLRAAYAARDARAAAAAYAPNGELINRYAGYPVERFRGHKAIEGNFVRLFAGIDPDKKIDLNFRFTAVTGLNREGVYRLRIGKAGYFGRFQVQLTPDGKFLRDESLDGTLSSFEYAAGPVLFLPDDEELDPNFYDSFVGRYRISAKCDVVITRSALRLFALDSCSNQWRGLQRISGSQWAAGEHVLPKTPKLRYNFAAPANGRSRQLKIGANTASARRDLYRLESVSFTSRDGTRLAGTMYVPLGPVMARPATVLIHGSGGQLRNGYASIMALMADQMASRGRVVLIYDKRGVGDSEGDWTRAGFATLADDAAAGMNFLASRREVDPARLGLAGSSQAGWIIAQAIRQGAKPADIFLLGAAGTSLTVAEQNVYNTQVQMQCAGVPQAGIALALAQQQAFFAFLKDATRAGHLDELTAQARHRPALANWLFPDSKSTVRDSGQWYTTLDPDFDPLPVWKAYRGRALFVFAEHDDSTPTEIAMARLTGMRIEQRLLKGAQHLGLVARDKCRTSFGEVSAFSPELWSALDSF